MSKEKITLERGGVALTPRELFYEVQRTIKVGKGKFNAFSKFYFRSVEDIYNAWKDLNVPLVLLISDHIINIDGRIFIEATATIKDLAGNIIESSTAQAELGAGKAGMSTEQATGSASSYARKYALNGLFLLDDAEDPDAKDPKKTGGAGTVAMSTATAAERSAKIKELQGMITGNPEKAALAKSLLGDRNLLKLTTGDINEIIERLK